MRENQRDFWAILAALTAIGVGTLVTSVNASDEGKRLNEQTIESNLEKSGWPIGSTTSR